MTPDHPPPSYLDIDPDLISLRSAAPSYTSSIPPMYTPRRTYTSLIPPSSQPSPIPTHHAFNVASWPSLTNQGQSRAYLNVAARRARRAMEEAEAEVGALMGASTISLGLQEEVQEVDVHQDFDTALRMESRAWDFFTKQMNDWEQREVSWKAFKAKHERALGKGKGKGKKIRWGFYGRL
ncbi:hypothetical protein FPQ18DRAFT_258725 [Pyronema domesticum]|nr:hypothetical protein FPQ18DRAFT_258725 [Pyronema domesticum]